MNNSKGFTLMELMVAVGIASILVSIAVPEFKRWNESQRLSSSVRNIHSLFQMSRLEAIKEGRNVVVVFSEGVGNSGTYLAFVDDDGDRVADAGEETIATGNMPNHINMLWARFDLSGSGTENKDRTHFDSRGLATGRNGEIQLKNLYGKVARIVLNSAGSSRVITL